MKPTGLPPLTRGLPGDDDPFELTLTRSEASALLCHREVCNEHATERVYAERKIRDALWPVEHPEPA